MLLSAAGLTSCSCACISLADINGSLLAIGPSLPSNTPSTSYKLNKTVGAETASKDTFNSILSKVGDEFIKAFKIKEFQDEMSARMSAVESRLQVEGMKAVEIDHCKQELKQLKHSLSRSKLQTSSSFSKPHKRGVPPYPKYTLTQETEEYLKKPTFDIWDWEPNEMISLMEHMYQELGLVASLHMNPHTLKRWLLAIQENYHDNPFHNFRHCFCVTQMMYGMIHLCHLHEHMSQMDLAILMTAAICHDLDHPGFSNSYQINARTELAIRYNDCSPLENHHCAVAFQILEKPDQNIFAYVSKEDFKNIRKGIIDLILATDMSRHNELMERWKKILDQGMDYKLESHIEMLKMMVIKCCDISNEVRPAEISEPWLDCLLEEYFHQSDREKDEGLPITPFMDRDKVTKSSAQIGFIRFVLLPLFESMCRLFPQLEEPMVNTLKSSLEHYEGIKAEEEKSAKNRQQDKRQQDMGKKQDTVKNGQQDMTKQEE